MPVFGPVDQPSPPMDFWQNLALAGSGGGGVGVSSIAHTGIANSLLLQPLAPIADNWQADMTVQTAMLNIAATATGSSSFSSSISLGIYTLANETQLALLNSASTQLALAAGASNSRSFNGTRWWTLGAGQWSSSPVFTQGGDYFLGLLIRTSNYGTASIIGEFFAHSALRSGVAGSDVSSGNTWLKWAPFLGVLSATTSALPTAVAASAVNASNSIANFIPHIVFNNLIHPASI